MNIRDLFQGQIDRRIEEVIKVDQTDTQINWEEIQEYVPTASIKRYYTQILERYYDTPNHPHEGIAVWVSGFFGSGKSSFAKLLGLALENQDILGKGASERIGQQLADPKIQVLLKNVSEHIPTTSVIFDVSTDRGIRAGNQTLTEIMYKLFLRELGYARDLDLAELEITLEESGLLDAFKAAYKKEFDKEWDRDKERPAFALSAASNVMHLLDGKRFATVDTWLQAAKERADITAGLLAERCKLLMKRRRPGQTLTFVVDEVGQFVSRDVQKMLDLAAIVGSLGRVGRGKMWVVVTSQEKLSELVSGIGDRRVELARLMDRFPQELQVHLEPSDISEVTSKRVLSKNAAGEAALRQLFDANRARLTEQTRISADIALPELTAGSFINLYPLLPYQIDLIIQIVSGLRTQGGASAHVGGANRTIIKIAQQLLINPATKLADSPLGVLATIDQIYDLISGNISSEIRGKIQDIATKVADPMAQKVAKAICLLQFVKSVHRTVENIAASLHPSVDSDSVLPTAKDAIEELVKGHYIRQGDDGFRIPTPAEDDWERQRAQCSPQPGDESRILGDVIKELWEPQPLHNLASTKLFKCGLFFNAHRTVEGDIDFFIVLAAEGSDFTNQETEMRSRSRTDTKSVFWVGATNAAITQKVREVYRSREILSKKERGAQTPEEGRLVAEEKKRLRTSTDELRLLLKGSILSGSVFFRGNDRSPSTGQTQIKSAAETILATVLPEVFHRFTEGAAKVKPTDLNALLSTENLRVLPQVFSDLDLTVTRGTQTTFRTDSGPLFEILGKIQSRTTYGEIANGRYLTEEFAREPFGWDFDVVRLFIGCLLRAGLIEATSQGQTIESALSLEAKNTFSNNNLFRAASFRPKQSGLTFIDWAQAAEDYKGVFGKEVGEIEQGVIANAIRESVSEVEGELQNLYTTMVKHQFPGSSILKECLDQILAIRRGNDEQAITGFRATHNQIKEGIQRGHELREALTETHIVDWERGQNAIRNAWPFLKTELNLDGVVRDAFALLEDVMKKETFFHSFSAIDQNARKIEEAYQNKHREAADRRLAIYTEAVEHVKAQPSWPQLTPEQQQQAIAPLESFAKPGTANDPIPQLRSEAEACDARLKRAVEAMMRIVDGARLVRITVSEFFQRGSRMKSNSILPLVRCGKKSCTRLAKARKSLFNSPDGQGNAQSHPTRH
jgi:hypothetical protein